MPQFARSPILRSSRLLAPLALGVALTYVFWSGLWTGGGLIGGDLYTYFFPQKAFYADRLAAGEFPLWNNRAGHGYPLVAESQTGAFYPLHLAAYALWDVNTAYSAVQLLHYFLASVFMWMYARRLGLRAAACALAALVYTYGWFPPRIALEWSIIGGAWLPLALWCIEDWLAARRRTSLAGLAAALAMQMLAGHFNLAFITLLTIGVYVPARLFFARGSVNKDVAQHRGRSLLLAASAVVLALGLAAVQLIPTWELKVRSQRATVGGAFNPAYGYAPPEYWSLIVAPWLWYDYFGGLEPAPPELPGTNAVEAHLYFGLLPVALLLYGAVSGLVFRDRRLLLWLVLGVAALLYTPGWLLPVTQSLPGFGFFTGPGRYGIVTTFAMAVLAAAALDRLLARRRGTAARSILATAVLGLTAADLWMMSRMATYTITVETPPVERLDQSPVRRLLLDFESSSGPVRLFARGPNLPTLLGVASTPAYLGIGPQEYFNPRTAMPGGYPFDEPPTPEQVDWLRRAGVTHVLSFTPLSPPDWPVSHVWSGHDPFLNQAWGRRDPLYLYRLAGSRGRVAWQDPSPGASARVLRYAANEVVVEAFSQTGGVLILTDLAYPGWEVSVGGEPAEPLVIEGAYRGLRVPPGDHRMTWRYRPRSVLVGAAISGAVVMALIALATCWWLKNRSRRQEHPDAGPQPAAPEVNSHHQSPSAARRAAEPRTRCSPPGTPL